MSDWPFFRGSKVRKPAVAGVFYPADCERLHSGLRQYIQVRESPVVAKAIVAPHAGYLYSGGVAGMTYGSVRLPRRFIILCPNHTGLGAPVAVMSEGQWETPLGRVPIDTALARALQARDPLAEESPEAHRKEHSLEVHLPFLQHLRKNDLQFVPVCVKTRQLDQLLALGRSLSAVVQESEEPVLLISSSDMNHFESAERTEAKDRMAIDRILELDPSGLYETVEREDISMCGYGPTVAVLEASLQLGAKQAELVAHSHSGEITGDHASVVGYAGLVIY